jgi:protein arginine phosphatase
MSEKPAPLLNANGVPEILFVCLGNLCRSPMAEELMKKRLSEAGLLERYHVHSAGIIARLDQVPPIEAVRAAEAYGVDLRHHLSTPLTAALLERASLVVAMDRMNVELILNLVPDLGPRLRLMTSFAEAGAEPTAMGGRRANPFDVPDPMGGPPELYRESYRRIADGIAGLLDALRTS